MFSFGGGKRGDNQCDLINCLMPYLLDDALHVTYSASLVSRGARSGSIVNVY